MLETVILDFTPLGIYASGKATPLRAEFSRWLDDLSKRGIRIVIPEVADYEIRREAIRRNAVASLRRLDFLATTTTYLPITTDAMRLAAQLWAQARQAGRPTADPLALDGDVILAAQTLLLGLPTTDFIVATSNANHLALFVPTGEWRNIKL